MPRVVSLDPSSTVYTEVGEPLSFHDPRKLETTEAMTEYTFEEIQETEAVACSHCFSDQDADYFLGDAQQVKA